MDTVNKKKFAYKIAEKGGFYKKDAVKMTELFWETLMDFLSEGKKVNFYGTGHFELKTVKEKEARNPKTGEACIVPEHKKVKFYPSETLTEKIEDE
ncbi:HU family DNA-binding protein [Petralouisia muris]|jgi:nucleoid DNA-binding protein|uniref:HU family DNA-binding protein n=1 Tax=Petralouisia muris TaxID=3032872 RepID=A0AC61RNQ9_9FIRM|nr:HU family DNA-binding protein [Petralouisia muris]TGY87734.1 HU family DNA-binding protein [Petralouisia muris]